ncbi:hypothetical protein [Micromonospora sp. IBHARD004]|uniref:hypothetical protein n=1 Tax=Micromonospora sp. IBHARD004 TaxID=3457764 RepID=UPI00405903A0
MADLSRPIRLAIVDDDPLVRAGLRILPRRLTRHRGRRVQVALLIHDAELPW